jgi:hypothetical protein
MDATKPQGEAENPYLPQGTHPIVFDTFVGINTDASRPGIKDEEMYWCDGFMPLGKNNCRVLPGVGDAIFDVFTGLRITWFQSGNIGETPVLIVLQSDGSLAEIKTDTGTSVLIAPSGTIQNPSTTSIDMTQWGSQYIVIIAKQTNGLFIWDGTTLFMSGSLGPDITILNGGLDYTSAPTVTAFGGSGSGATFIPTVESGVVNTITVGNPGAGYSSTDQVVLAFSGGGNPNSTAIGNAIVTDGTVSGVSMVSGGLGYTASTSIAIIGGGGTGATATVSAIVGTAISTVSITAPGQGYSSINPPTLLFNDPANTLAVATVDLMPVGISGNAVETYQSRLWLASVARIEFTAPESLTDFNVGDGAGGFTSNDSFLRVGFTKLIQTNGFLYLIADSSINYISGVQTAGNPITTTFTNQNADPEIGTPYGPTVQVFSRNIVFANEFGVHVSYGGAVTKISEALDGVFNTVPNFGGFVPSSAKAIIYGKRVYMVLVPVIDIATNQQVNKLFMWNGKTWWSSEQDIPLTYIASQEINSVLTAWGTDGLAIYPLFQKPSVGFTKRILSKLWDNPGSYLVTKTANRVWGLAYYYSSLSPELRVGVDNEDSSAQSTLTLGPGSIAFVNASNQSVVFLNAFNTPVALIGTSGGGATGVVVFPPTAVGQNGVLNGLTISTNAADMALISMILENQVWGYRG